MQLKFGYFVSCFILLVFTLVSIRAEALLKVNITQGNSEKILLSIKICDGSNNDLWHEISDVIKSDLNGSGILNVIDDKNSSIECDSSASINTLGSAGKENSTILLSLYADYNNNKMQVKFKLFDLLIKSEIAAKVLSAKIENHRRIAHIIADNVYNRLTGEDGYFDAKILYIAENGGRKRVAIMDQDGENNKFITSGENLVLTPRFSPDNKKIVYTLYLNNQAKVYHHDLSTGNKKIIGDFLGVISAPRFSPDGKSVILARSIDGETDIYTIDLRTGRKKKLTVKSSINTSPSYSPDQKKIVFNSDRTGVPQLYIMDADGSNQKKISRGIGSYMSPVWSPKSDLIAFTKIYNKRFYIGVMRSNGSDERIIADGYLVESPSWSPNGKLIVFTKESFLGKKRSSAIHIIDVMGFNERVIKTEHNASEPSWSSLL